MKAKKTIWGFAARIICVLTLVSFGFTASAASADTRELSAAELAAYMLPDGSLPVLCVTLPDGSGNGKIIKLGIDTLSVHPAATLPAPVLAGGYVLRSGTLSQVPRKDILLRKILYPPGAGPRAPPAHLQMI
jgi:hypothetical protein